MARFVVTGAASGIGRAVAQLLVEQGDDVVAVDRDPTICTAVPNATAVVADIRDELDRLQVARVAGRVDGLVNAAGVIRISRLDEVTPEDWDLVLDINLKSLFFLTRELVPLMRRGSAVVNVASTAGKAPITPEVAPYSASKAGVIALTKAFAYAYASRDIRVNCVCPGNVATPMHEQVTHDLAKARGLELEAVTDQYNEAIPLGRDAKAEEVAAVISFLLSDKASYMTGQAVNVSGGFVMY